MITVTTPDGEEKKFRGNLTIEKNPDTDRAIRILDGTTPVYVIPDGANVHVSQDAAHPHPRTDQ